MSLLFSTGAIAGSAAKGAPGMVLLTPTSITHSGTSATLGANGQVTFSAVTSLSLNGCFTADFDNYMIVVESTGSTPINISARLRSSGTDATGTDYTRQYLYADGTTVAAARQTSKTFAVIAYADSSVRRGSVAYIYGPFLAQPTAFRNNGTAGSTLFLIDEAHTHSLSTSYDGFTAVTDPAAGTITGKLAVYGIRS